jgi:DNA-binding transcriptional LysR family regulator
MNLRGIDLNLLPVFEAIYVERSLTRAGEVLNVTQPAVSSALGRLRQVLDDPLFVRHGHGVAPTPAAEALIGPVREGLARLRTGLDVNRPFVPAKTEQVFNVAAGDVAVSALMPQLATALAESAPGARFYFYQTDRAVLAGELAAGRIDLAIDIESFDRTELESVELLRDHYVCAMRKGHPAMRRTLDLDNFLSLRHVAVSGRRAGHTVVDLALNRLGKRLNPHVRFVHYAPAFGVVMGTDLALVTPSTLAEVWDVDTRPLPIEVPALTLRLFWRRENDSDAGIRWARELLMDCVRPARRNGLASP